MVTTLDRVHPAERRRIAASLPPAPAHDVVLRPLGAGDGAAIIVSAREESFLPAIFEDLQADDWRTRLAARRSVRRGTDHILELGLPIHRHFQIALFEAVCKMPGFPPVDPKKLTGMGLVLRRREKTGMLSGWMRTGDQPKGWLTVAPGLIASDEPDPDPARRVADTGSASGQLAALLAARRGGTRPLAEEVIPLFIAPPEVCAARGRTILYGIVPVASSDKAGTTAIPDFTALDDPAEAAAVLTHLSEYLKARPKLSMVKPGAPLDPKWHVLQTPTDADGLRLNAFGIFLQQLKVELGAFDGGSAGNALLGALRGLSLPMMPDDQGHAVPDINAADFVAQAANILIDGADNPNGLRMPAEWPAIDAAAGGKLTSLALSCITARYREMITETPKFDRDEALYTVRGFVRVSGHAHCAPSLVWSTPYSELFRILPWWDSDGAAARIALPSVSKLRKVKPNITFEMPPALANLLQGDMKKLKDGDGEPPSELGIGWLCSFSIPIITICAFIVLNIFLTLFDIVFFWMAFLKICIPYPKPK